MSVGWCSIYFLSHYIQFPLLCGVRRLPNIDSFLPLPSAGAAGAASGELWEEDPQDKWSRQLLGPYPKTRWPGLASHGQQGSWLASPQFVTESRLILLSAQQANKLRDELLGQKMETLFGKPADWESVCVSKNHLSWVRSQASFLLTGEGLKSRFWPGGGCVNFVHPAANHRWASQEVSFICETKTNGRATPFCQQVAP